MKSSTKQWIHTPDQLTKGQITYNVKFLGECAVEQPKGTEVVKDAIRKMKFNRHLKRAEGQRPPKVQLTVSVDGVGIQDPKAKAILHEYPLHRISYCADDKSDKQMFTFIAKAATTNDHYCYVFKCSDKSAEEITLTVGQAFDLAYKRFLEEGSMAAGPGGDDSDYRKQCLVLQRRVYALEFENDALKKRVYELEKLKDRSDLEEFMKNNKEAVSDRPGQHQSMVGRRLENLILDSDTNGQTNSKASHSAPQSPVAPILSPPPPVTRHHRQLVASVSSPVQSSFLSATAPSSQLTPPSSQQAAPADVTPFFTSGQAPPAVTSLPRDPFGMGAFSPSPQHSPFSPSPQQHSPLSPSSGPQVLSANGSAAFAATSHLELMDIQAGFSRGLSFGTDDFNLGDLDPLSQRL